MVIVPGGNRADELEEVKGADAVEDDELGSKEIALANVVRVVAPSREEAAESRGPLVHVREPSRT